jgi:hypothetical protein
MDTLFDDMRMSRITKADCDDSLIKILKKQQELIEQNQKKIKEQQELIEHLWAWAEEKDDEEKTPSEADAEAYLNTMYPLEEEQEKEEHYWDWAGVAAALQEKYKTEWDDTTPKQCEDEIDYRNFKLYDEYEGEKEGYTYLNDGPQGPGYYGLKTPLQWTPCIY